MDLDWCDHAGCHGVGCVATAQLPQPPVPGSGLLEDTGWPEGRSYHLKTSLQAAFWTNAHGQTSSFYFRTLKALLSLSKTSTRVTRAFQLIQKPREH